MAILNAGPLPFTLRQLQYVVAVGELGSFRRAAEHCHVAQPSLSTQIAEVESALGVQLFERDRRGVLVTQAGKELLERARALLVGARDLADAMARRGDPLTGVLRIGAIPTIAPYLVPEIAPALRKKFGALQIQWSEDQTSRLMAALQAGELDGALVATEADLGDVEHAVLLSDPFVLAAPAGHPLVRSKKPLHAADLNGVELLVLAEGHCLRDQALSACKRARTSAFGATSLATLVQMVAGGAGVTLLPTLALRTEGRRSGLAVRPFVAPGPHRTIALVWRRGSAVAGAMRALAAVMKR
jgi:LysR family hydrogen peroxide-inducible transcriptional activator